MNLVCCSVWMSVTLVAVALHAAEIRIVSWPSEHASPPAVLPKGQESLLSWIRLGVGTLPEPIIMQAAFAGGTALGLPLEAGVELQKEFSARYLEMSKDPVFGNSPSLLSYAYAAEKPKEGKAFVVVPAKVGPDTKVILFLHGYAGPFQLYPYFLHRSFPDAIILCPAYGISTADISTEYLTESRKALEKELKITLSKPVLIGLSAGGFGAFREVARNPEAYAGMICLAAYPPPDMRFDPKSRTPMRILAGANEGFVRNGTLAASLRDYALREPMLQGKLLEDQDHFFLLTAEAETRSHLLKWVNEMDPPRQKNPGL